MTPEQQRIKIAEACGWNAKPTPPPSNEVWGAAGNKPHWSYIHQLPNYPGDLNACHEMEKVLTWEHAKEYYARLALIRGRDYRMTNVWHDYNIASATAPQRCEAFLRTLGLWEENEKGQP